MNFLQAALDWLKARLHIKPTQLKGAPGVSDPAATADVANAVVGSVLDAQAVKLTQ